MVRDKEPGLCHKKGCVLMREKAVRVLEMGRLGADNTMAGQSDVVEWSRGGG